MVNREHGRPLIAAQVQQSMSQAHPDTALFQARLISLNKLKNGEIPTVLGLRPLAVTGLI